VFSVARGQGSDIGKAACARGCRVHYRGFMGLPCPTLPLRHRRARGTTGKKAAQRAPSAPRPGASPSGSGGRAPVGAFGTGVQRRRKLGCHLRQRMPGQRQGRRRLPGRKQHRATAVAGVAVQVGSSQVDASMCAGTVGIVGGCVALVLMRMVAKMRRCGRLLMRAIGRCCGPDGLQRHQHKQENKQEATHGSAHSMQLRRPGAHNPGRHRGCRGRL